MLRCAKAAFVGAEQLRALARASVAAGGTAGASGRAITLPERRYKVILHAAKAGVRSLIKDTRVEPYLWWCWKRSRGIRIPMDNVRNEIYDRQGFEIIERVLDADSNGIDIGCHEGEYLRRLLEVAPHGRHFAFEPIPSMAAALAERFPQVDVFQMALSDNEGNAEFFYFPDKPALSGLARRNERTDDTKSERIEVRVASLDTVVPSEMVIRFIKIDVEGAEGQVLTGAKKLIAKNHPFILFEHGGSSSRHFGWTSEALYDFLTEQCGLLVSRVGDWLTGARPLTRQEFGHSGGWYFLAHR